MKVLVTGGSGLIGSNLQEYVYEGQDSTVNPTEWIFVNSKNCCLDVESEVYELFERVQPTHVINLAAYVGGLFKNMREPVDFFRKNMLINMNVMAACHAFKVEKLISVLSTCIFPDQVEYPITEEKLHDGPPHSSNEGYAYAKRMVDVLSRMYNRQYNTNFVTVVPGNLYGSEDNFHLEDAHVIPALIHKCYRAQYHNEPFVVFGTGSPLRQFTYAPDLAKLLVWVLHNYNDEQPIILSNPEEVKISQVVEQITDAMLYDGEVTYDTSKEDGQYRKTVSSEKLLMDYPFHFTDLRKGIYETVHWFVGCIAAGESVRGVSA